MIRPVAASGRWPISPIRERWLQHLLKIHCQNRLGPTRNVNERGAFFLKQLDERMQRSGLFYVRFMDDILVLAPTRRRLRKAVKAVNKVLGSLGMEKHPDKTFIGRIEKGFDLPLLPFRPGRAFRGKENHRTVHRTCDPALRARAGEAFGLLPARVIRATMDQVGGGLGGTPLTGAVRSTSAEPDLVIRVVDLKHLVN